MCFYGLTLRSLYFLDSQKEDSLLHLKEFPFKMQRHSLNYFELLGLSPVQRVMGRIVVKAHSSEEKVQQSGAGAAAPGVSGG